MGTLALSGFPGFSGYFSKDLIIAWAVVEKPILGWIAVLTAGLTSFYMFRLLAVVFLGTPRSDHAEHAHESPAVMVVPLILLAIPALGPVTARSKDFSFTSKSPSTFPTACTTPSWRMFFIGAGLALFLYRKPAKDPVFIPLFANRLVH